MNKNILTQSKSVKGICFCKKSNKWKAHIFLSKRIHLGYFNTKSDAIAARLTAEKDNNYTDKYHGHSKTKLYNVWGGIKRRCYNSSQKSYKYYGEKGVKMCDDWKNSYELFLSFALSHGYKNGLEIDRINPSGDYEPNNCRFITGALNKSLAFKGKKHSIKRIEKNSIQNGGLPIDDIDELIEASQTGLFKNHELSSYFNLDRHAITRTIKRYGFTPVWNKQRG